MHWRKMWNVLCSEAFGWQRYPTDPQASYCVCHGLRAILAAEAIPFSPVPHAEEAVATLCCFLRYTETSAIFHLEALAAASSL